MATILAFRPGAERTQPAGHRLAALGDAEIVIFPGVRYERWADTPDNAGNGAQAKVKRDRLQIVD